METEKKKDVVKDAKKDQKADGAPAKKPTKKDEKKEEELSEEDLRLKEELELLVTRAQDVDVGVQKLALNQLITEIKSSTSSMTSVPKPLKFLRPHYDKLKEVYEPYPNVENKKLLSDILSILAMTMAKPGTRESLKFRLNGSGQSIGSWGHEFVRFLSGEISQEWDERQKDTKPVDDLIKLVDEIVPFDITHNAEHEACDLLLEVQKLDKVIEYADEANYTRICLYLTACAQYLPEPDDSETLKVVLSIYKKMKQYPDALRIAIKMNDQTLMKSVLESCEDSGLKKQLGFMLARQRIFIETEDSQLNDIIYNTKLSEYYLALAQDLDIMEPKIPEDIYKSSTNEQRSFAANVDSARQNLASTFVNGFVNAGFGIDKLMTEEGNKWIYKNKEHGMMSAAASLGMILLWDVDGGLSQIDKYLYASEDYIKAGAVLAVGIVNASVKNDVDPARALLGDYLENPSTNVKMAAVLGLGLAYAGSARDDLRDTLLPFVEDSKASMESVSNAALALGMIFVGTADAEITASLCATFMERDEASLNVSHSRFLALGLGLLYLGKQEAAEATIETLKTISHTMGKYASLTVETCAYAGTGNVLKVHKLLDMCADHLDEKDKSQHQSIAVLGIALIALGEEVGSEMALRSYDHLLQYADPVIRRAVPLALALQCLSNPKITVMDTLSKLSHDHDEEVSMGAIFGLGLLGAGTNNARVAGLLRNLASYYYKEPNHLFMVRLAQGLVFMGKGTLSLSPYHSDRFLLSHVSLAGILTVLHASMDIKNVILGKSHYLLYTLVLAMYPRLLMTFDANLKPLPVSVRVGQAVDTVGQAGRPKTITGFQTHNTPVLLGFGDRAELATDDYLTLTSVLEGFAILKVNPQASKKEEEVKKK